MVMMLMLIVCLGGILLILLTAELLKERKVLKGEYLRKFVHILAGAFIAFWPWLLSWRTIQILSLLMILAMVTNKNIGFFNYRGRVRRPTYGDYFFAAAIFLSATFSHSKIIFALAILEVALADGLAAVVGIAFGKRWSYKVFGNTKTVIGTMVFWVVSVAILAAGLLAAHDVYSFKDYYYLVLLLPPALTLLENMAVFGIDNLVIPIFLIIVLRAVQP
jgi:dolichol kinase